MAERQAAPNFDVIADSYDNVRFTKEPTERLPVHAKLASGQRVLDVACGTGWASMAAARAVGDTGRVTGIDIGDEMLDVARGKAVSLGLSNVEYRPGSAEELEFGDASFDRVICASSIFYFSDMTKALREWHRVLKTGGRVAFSTWGVTFRQPTGKPFSERLAQYGTQGPPTRNLIEQTDTPDKCRELLKSAGFEEIEVTTEQLGYYHPDTTAYWQEISSTIVRPRLESLSPAELNRFKAEHLAEVESLRTDRGIWFDVPVHFSTAKKQ